MLGPFSSSCSSLNIVFNCVGCQLNISSLQRSMNVLWGCTFVHHTIHVLIRLEPTTVTATRLDGTLTLHQEGVKVNTLNNTTNQIFLSGQASKTINYRNIFINVAIKLCVFVR